MAGKDDRWSMFKNYMHNELQISKDDIKLWLIEAVKEEARKLINNTEGDFFKVVKDAIIEELSGYYGLGIERLRDNIAQALVDKIEFKIKD